MLDVVYIALVVAPLTLAALAMLLMVVRSFRGHSGAREERRRSDVERAHDHPGGMRKRSAPLAEPASIASLGEAGLKGISRSVVGSLVNDPRSQAPRPSLEELSALVESLSHPPREQEAPAVSAPPPARRVGAPAAGTKECPDCAEEVLAAARVCKHCRYRFDEPDAMRRLSA